MLIEKGNLYIATYYSDKIHNLSEFEMIGVVSVPALTLWETSHNDPKNQKVSGQFSPNKPFLVLEEDNGIHKNIYRIIQFSHDDSKPSEIGFVLITDSHIQEIDRETFNENEKRYYLWKIKNSNV